MSLREAFKTFVKNNQTRYLSKTWHDKIALRQVERNNYLATGDLKRAKYFAAAVSNPPEFITERSITSPIVIFRGI